jgi:hypothetical protein
MKNTLLPSNAKKAFAVAAIADAMQLPLYAALFTGVLALPSEIIDATMDITAMILICRWVGFHWCLLPCFLLEFVPGLELIPTWTAAVAFIVSKRKGDAPPPPTVTVVDVEVVTPARPPLTANTQTNFGQNN